MLIIILFNYNVNKLLGPLLNHVSLGVKVTLVSNQENHSFWVGKVSCQVALVFYQENHSVLVGEVSYVWLPRDQVALGELPSHIICLHLLNKNLLEFEQVLQVHSCFQLLKITGKGSRILKIQNIQTFLIFSKVIFLNFQFQ